MPDISGGERFMPENIRYFDMHCDTITECAEKHCSLNRNGLHISMENVRGYKPWAQFFAIWIPGDIHGEDAENRFRLVYKVFLEQMKDNKELLSFCGNSAELKRAAGYGRNAAFLSIEGSAALNGKIENLKKYYDLGVRLITITWNGSCEAGDGCRVENAKGLTRFGKDLVSEMSKMNIITDVSHLSDQGFYDVAQETQKPFVASHSNSRAVCGHPRNLTDEQFREIVRRRGIVGLNFYRDFICGGGKEAAYQDILPHIDHFLELGGENAIAIGADFDGAEMPKGISGARDMKNVYRMLADRYSERMADKIFFANAYEFVKTALTECGECNNIIK